MRLTTDGAAQNLREKNPLNAWLWIWASSSRNMPFLAGKVSGSFALSQSQHLTTAPVMHTVASKTWILHCLLASVHVFSLEISTEVNRKQLCSGNCLEAKLTASILADCLCWWGPRVVAHTSHSSGTIHMSETGGNCGSPRKSTHKTELEEALEVSKKNEEFWKKIKNCLAMELFCGAQRPLLKGLSCCPLASMF